MKPIEFCYWLQGLLELLEPKSLNEEQTEMIKRNLQLVFVHKVDKEQQGILNNIYNQYGYCSEPKSNNPNKK